MKWHIETIQPADAEALLAFLHRLGGETDNLSFGSEGLPFTAEAERAWIEDGLKSGASVRLAAKIGNQIIGNCGIEALPRRFSHRGELDIGVLREYWNCGIGSALLEQALRVARETLGLEIISLAVRSDNLPAIHLYQKFGFEKIGTYPRFQKIGSAYYDADYMNLYLKP